MNWNNLFQLEKVIWNRNKFEVNFQNINYWIYTKAFLNSRINSHNVDIQNSIQYQKLSNHLPLEIFFKKKIVGIRNHETIYHSKWKINNAGNHRYFWEKLI